jgi:hypothetical protein
MTAARCLPDFALPSDPVFLPLRGLGLVLTVLLAVITVAAVVQLKSRTWPS